jgi:hypothetical protein
VGDQPTRKRLDGQLCDRSAGVDRRVPRGLLVRALVEVSCEGWALALVALAVFSFFESEVKGVLKVFLPLGVALLAAGAVALLARAPVLSGAKK